MSAVLKAAELVAFPVGAAIAGSVAASVKRPGPKVTSGVQHLAGGVVFAALAGEVLPDLRSRGSLPWMVTGFAVGVALLLALRAFGARLEAKAELAEQAGGATAASLPVGMLAAVGIDLLIDGSLIGLGVTLGGKQGMIITVALTLEILFLSLSVCADLLDREIAPVKAASISAGLSLATAVGAISGAALLGGASQGTMAAILAFGAAALLYLVVEELLVEAHEQAETAFLAALFFGGFLGMFILAGQGDPVG